MHTYSPALTGDIADELMAGRSFPARQRMTAHGRLVPRDAARAVAWAQDVQTFWLDAADGYLSIGNAEGNQDAAEALGKARVPRPRHRSHDMNRMYTAEATPIFEPGSDYLDGLDSGRIEVAIPCNWRDR